jgi:hypothetical protein
MTLCGINRILEARSTLQHQSLDPLRGCERVWRQLIWVHDCHQCNQCWFRFANKESNFQPTAVENMTRCGTNRILEARNTLQHQSIDPLKEFEMVRRQLIWVHDCQCHQCWFRFANKAANFQPTAVSQNMTWCGTNRILEARSTLQHQSLDPLRVCEMVLRQLIWVHDCQCHQCWFRFANIESNFQPTAV